MELAASEGGPNPDDPNDRAPPIRCDPVKLEPVLLRALTHESVDIVEPDDNSVGVKTRPNANSSG
jgi:hypothetical protein